MNATQRKKCFGLTSIRLASALACLMGAVGGAMAQGPGTPAAQPGGSFGFPWSANKGASAPAKTDPFPAAPSAALKPASAAVVPGIAAYPVTQEAEANGPAPSVSAKDHRDALLRAARVALAEGNLDAARSAVEKAKQIDAPVAFNDDTCGKVAGLVERRLEMASGPPRGADPAAFRTQFASMLLDQAEGLIQHGEIAHAERVAKQAKDLGAQFRALDRSPDKVLSEIAALRTRRQPVTSNEGFSVGNSAPALLPSSAGSPASPASEAQRLVTVAKAELTRGNVEEAERLVRQAESLNIPDSAYAAGDTRPWEVLLEIGRVRSRRDPQIGGSIPSPSIAGSSAQPIPSIADSNGSAARGLYNPGNDSSRVMRASAEEPAAANTKGTPPAAAPKGAPAAAAPPSNEAERLMEEGLKALDRQDREAGMQMFRQAWKLKDQLNAQGQQRLQDLLSQAGGPAPNRLPAGAPPAPLGAAEAGSQTAYRQLLSEVTAEQAAAGKQLASDPRGALTRLQQLQLRLNKTDLEPPAKKQLLTLVDRYIGDVEKYIEQNRAKIELDEANRKVYDAVDQTRRVTIESQTKLAGLVEEFNRLMDQQRFAEAQVIAKQAREIDPENTLTQNLVWQSSFAMNLNRQMQMKEHSQEGFVAAMGNVEESGIAFDDNNPLQFGSARTWRELTERRNKREKDANTRLNPAEMEIYKSLGKAVEVNFSNRPLGEVLDTLGRMTGVNIYLDLDGIAAEGLTADSPVNLPLNRPVSLKSALNLILQQKNLGYVIQNEVLRVTSESARQTNVYTKVYNVADLVIPIPNFVPSYNMGLPGAIRESMAAAGYGPMANPGMGGQPLTVASAADGHAPGGGALAQMMGSNMPLPGGFPRNHSQSLGSGPGGLGGGAQADFDTLIELIRSTVAPESWDETGGKGAVEPFETNLSLVVSQTQEVHDQIADLLQQLRRLQDLQVTIEVRFITLNDTFFERIGVDFDFQIDDNIPAGVDVNALDDSGPSVTVGQTLGGQFTADRDIVFNQGSFGDAVPPALPGLPPFNPANAANIGFAILSDIEVFFLLQAAQADTRTNVMQAPKVTLFNGQQAVVSDTSQRPFVTSIIPVVGDFAAAQQPVVVVLSEGTSLSVQSVVSNDRRFVRLTLVPFFSTIGDVQEFTFTGSTSTNTGTANGAGGGANNATTTTTGTTVQLPTFNFTTVTTTVSVPDGGTVLLGGVKRMSEGRNERGVPMLSKLPYVSRLFKNVGIARTSSSLMLMVTPRIIIQEEEEEKMGIANP